MPAPTPPVFSWSGATARSGSLDDGVGFDTATAGASGRLGLYGMSERAELLGGTLTVESNPGQGTSIYVQVPL